MAQRNSDATSAAAVETQAAQRQTLTEMLIASLLLVWRDSDNYDQDLVLARAARSSTLVEAAQRRQARLTTAFLSSVLRSHGVTPAASPGYQGYARTAPNGPLAVYQRPAEQYRYAVSRIEKELKTLPRPEPVASVPVVAAAAPTAREPVAPTPAPLPEPRRAAGPVKADPYEPEWTEPDPLVRLNDPEGARIVIADDAAMQRLRDLAEHDVLLADRDAAQRFLAAQETVLGYRRVVHPELAKDGQSCGLCIVAASRVYSKEELLPIHGHCNCTVLPVFEAADPGLKLNRADLDRIYRAAGDSTAAKLKRTRVEVRQNGELGPVLTRQGDNFVDLSQVRKNSDDPVPVFDRRKALEAQASTLSDSLARLHSRRDPDGRLAAPIAWQTARLAELQQQLAA